MGTVIQDHVARDRGVSDNDIFAVSGWAIVTPVSSDTPVGVDGAVPSIGSVNVGRRSRKKGGDSQAEDAWHVIHWVFHFDVYLIFGSAILNFATDSGENG